MLLAGFLWLGSAVILGEVATVADVVATVLNYIWQVLSQGVRDEITTLADVITCTE